MQAHPDAFRHITSIEPRFKASQQRVICAQMWSIFECRYVSISVYRNVSFQTPPLSVVPCVMRPKLINLRPDVYLTNPQFSVKFHQTRYNVDRILQERPVAIVYAVSSGSKRRVIKVVCFF
jgi:hypothetical protein